MNDFASKIEALEHRWMRAWIARDRKDMKALAARDLVVLFAGSQPAILDRASWLAATEARFRCSAYRFGTIYVRRQGKCAIFAAPMHLEASVDGNPVLKDASLVSVWSRTSVRRKWQMMERVLGGQNADPDLPREIRSMQLWR
jgi:ketosteroid isomerase-like protein